MTLRMRIWMHSCGMLMLSDSVCELRDSVHLQVQVSWLKSSILNCSSFKASTFEV